MQRVYQGRKVAKFPVISEVSPQTRGIPGGIPPPRPGPFCPNEMDPPNGSAPTVSEMSPNTGRALPKGRTYSPARQMIRPIHSEQKGRSSRVARRLDLSPNLSDATTLTSCVLEPKGRAFGSPGPEHGGQIRPFGIRGAYPAGGPEDKTRGLETTTPLRTISGVEARLAASTTEDTHDEHDRINPQRIGVGAQARPTRGHRSRPGLRQLRGQGAGAPLRRGKDGPGTRPELDHRSDGRGGTGRFWTTVPSSTGRPIWPTASRPSLPRATASVSQAGWRPAPRVTRTSRPRPSGTSARTLRPRTTSAPRPHPESQADGSLLRLRRPRPALRSEKQRRLRAGYGD
jgi:hypothetical protein